MVAHAGPSVTRRPAPDGDGGRSGRGNGDAGAGLMARRMYIHRMTDCGAESLAAALRSVGIDAAVLPPSDARTLELGARYLAGEECLPAKVTLGDFLKVLEAPGFDPGKTAFMMPTTEGPCRFGQYAPYIRKVFRDLGYPEVLVVSPTSGDGYQQMGGLGPELKRTGWRGIVATDILRKLLLKTRPYERNPGDTEVAYAVSLREICAILETPGIRSAERLESLVAALISIRDRFRAIPACYVKGRLLIGIQGEIFCRMNDFSNDELIRHLEACGGEAWLSDISEWVWYSNNDQERILRRDGKRFSLVMLGAKLRDHFQRADEERLREPFAEDFFGYEEPSDMEVILRAGDRYLPQSGAAGEMVISAGKVDYFFRNGVDGIIDISPFSCMNGIVSEALYPRQSQEHAGLPIKNFYFDGKGGNLLHDLEIFLELARAYQARKPHARRYPTWFR
jgi:predicted nucleotide-binding protein (sugar kinase/HSP70/actin superfamily)